MSKKLHIICGMCGCDDELNFQVDLKYITDRDGIFYPGVIISCDNCGTLTGLDEHLHQEETKNLELNK